MNQPFFISSFIPPILSDLRASRLAFLVAFFLTSLVPAAAHGQENRDGLPDCEWCGTSEAPADISWSASIAAAGEAGRRLRVSGVVTKPDGVTPAPGVLIYAYHTDAKGVYPKRGNETGNGRRHGYLRGWVRSDSAGRYEFLTIRPEPYPGGTNPAHIHMTVKEPGKDEQWIDEVHFDDDPILTPAARRQFGNVGGSGVVKVRAGKDGVSEAVRNIVLPR
jgi:protocatechuate 3,4-dioxygenase beta subunit